MQQRGGRAFAGGDAIEGGAGAGAALLGRAFQLRQAVGIREDGAGVIEELRRQLLR